MLPSPNQNLKLKKVTKMEHIYLSLSAHNASTMAATVPKKSQKSILKIVEALKRY
jgi:hypothetical protein